MNSKKSYACDYRHRATLTLIFVFILFAACSNPASNKPKAGVAEPASETQTTPAEYAEKLAITPANSKIEFVGSAPTESNPGSFKKFTGQIEFVDGRPEKSRVTVDIETDSIETEQPKLTTHLKSADFFDVAKFPKATFVSTEIRPGGEKGATHTVTGNLELHGVKKAITFPSTITVSDDRVTMQSEFAINRKDFGIVYPGPSNNLIRDEVVLKLSVTSPRAK